MVDEGKKEIIPARGRGNDLIKAVEKFGLILKPKEMDLVTARKVLQLVVNTHENSWHENSNLAKLGPYSRRDFGKALKVVSLDVFQSHQGEFTRNNFVMEKDVNHGSISGRLYFYILYDVESVSMNLVEGKEDPHKSLIDSHVYIKDLPPLISRFDQEFFKDKEPNSQRTYTNSFEEAFNLNAGVFTDQRPNHYAFVQPSGEWNIEKYRKCWLGLRWLAYNLLNWDGDFKLPEELGLGQPQLAQSQSRKALPSST